MGNKLLWALVAVLLVVIYVTVYGYTRTHTNAGIVVSLAFSLLCFGIQIGKNSATRK